MQLTASSDNGETASTVAGNSTPTIRKVRNFCSSSHTMITDGTDRSLVRVERH